MPSNAPNREPQGISLRTSATTAEKWETGQMSAPRSLVETLDAMFRDVAIKHSVFKNAPNPWRPSFPPPKDGESKIKTHEGKKYYGCARCRNWTISQETNNHKSKEELRATQTQYQSQPSARPKRVDFNVHPSVFMLINHLAQINSIAINAISNDRVLFDSGANCCITNMKEDFLDTFVPTSNNSMVVGIGKGLSVQGIGITHWIFNTTTEGTRTLSLPCHYVPSANTRIISTSVLLEEYPNEIITMDPAGPYLLSAVYG